MPPLTHEDIRALIRRYRERAQQTVQSLVAPDRLTIGDHAPVQLTEDGAFVETQLWVPKEG